MWVYIFSETVFICIVGIRTKYAKCKQNHNRPSYYLRWTNVNASAWCLEARVIAYHRWCSSPLLPVTVAVTRCQRWRRQWGQWRDLRGRCFARYVGCLSAATMNVNLDTVSSDGWVIRGQQYSSNIRSAAVAAATEKDVDDLPQAHLLICAI